MENLYDKCFDFLLELEGFHSDVRGDPGGRTIYGISEKWFPSQVKEMLSMSPSDAREYAKKFYKEKFWRDFSDEKLSAVAFLMSVNAPAPVKRAISEGRSWEGMLISCLEHYSKIVERNSDLLKFLRGWCNRIVRVWYFVKTMGD